MCLLPGGYLVLLEWTHTVTDTTTVFTIMTEHVLLVPLS
jgi:hypothetical protein